MTDSVAPPPVPPATSAAIEQPPVRVTRNNTGNEGYFVLVWRRFRRSIMGMVGLVLVTMLLLMAIFADFFAPMDPKAAAIAFVNSVLGPVPADNHGNIAVYSFDGDAAIHEISPFSSDRTSLTNAITGIACPGPYCEDSTTNLYGAVMRGIAALDQRILTVSPTRANIGGMFIIFTDGTDRAQRQTEAEALAAVMRTPSSVITVGAGAEIDKGVLGKLGRDGYYEAKSYKELSDAFVEVAGQVRDSAASHYTLYFCSDRRNAADHSLTIKVKPAGAGELSTRFNSAGFKGGCMLPMAAAMCK